MRVAQACERVLLFHDQGCILGGGQQLRGEGLGERRFLFVQLLQFSLVRIRQVCPGVHEFLVVELDQAQRFGVQLEGIALLINRRDALEQFGVEEDGIVVSGQPGCFEVLHLLQFRIQVRPGDAIECGHHAVE